MLNNKKTKFAISLIAAAMATSAPAQADISEYLDRVDVDFLLMQNLQSIQAKEGAFRPEDEEQESGFGRIRANLMLKFHINEFITADIDIAEEPNDFGGEDRDFSFHNDFYYLLG